ncbi:MAG: hypothetical protein K2X43_05605 [Hyphomonadaceae bacterium]|jgi:hypothetical protein|nr:hypothetical protein [Hyphomonadaceae bacterium]
MGTLRIVATAAMAAALAGHPLSAQPSEHPLTVTNSTDMAIGYLYVAGCGAGEWGKDRLGAKEIIEPGARKLFSIKGGKDDCCYDLRAKLQSGASRQKLAVDLCREAEWVVR